MKTLGIVVLALGIIMTIFTGFNIITKREGRRYWTAGGQQRRKNSCLLVAGDWRHTHYCRGNYSRRG